MAVTNGNDRDGDGIPDRRERKAGWLPWVLGAIALLILILALRSCGDDDRDAVTTTGDAPVATTVADGTTTTALGEPDAWDSAAFTTYLGGTEPVGRTFALDRVTFDSGSSLIKNEAQGQIGEVAAALKARPTARVSLRGYADPAGDAAANQELSETRTQAVRNALIKAGAAEDQIAAATALGETGAAAIEANRRVEITVTAR